MLSRNGRILAGSNVGIAENRFFDLWYRWSTIGCVHTGAARESRRSIRTTPSRNSDVPSTPKGTYALNLDRKLHPHNELLSSLPPSPKRSVAYERDTNTNTSAQKLVDGVRHMMRAVPNPVVVLTTVAAASPTHAVQPLPYSDFDHSLYCGMTLSSFSTVTLHPTPHVTFNIRSPSRTLSALTSTRYFIIHVLEANTEGAAMAAAFANAVYPGLSKKRLLALQEIFREAAGKGQLAVEAVYEHGKLVCSLPRFTGKGVKFSLECRVLGDEDRAGGGLIRVGHHVMVIARVCAMPMVGKGEEEVVDSGRDEGIAALSYAFGKYGVFGEMKEDVEKEDALHAGVVEVQKYPECGEKGCQ
ncbi:hypothetical protein LZ554_000202 [Drepanopeziza brunnea f. sp. 'monogermtubi']|nr:hypothetical protein LZ554_000202 [Drepanopeziza brunnea f. sp. 'monogermtubi']